MASHEKFQAETTNENKVHVTSRIFQRYYLIEIKNPPFKTNKNIFPDFRQIRFNEPISLQSTQRDHPQNVMLAKIEVHLQYD